MTKATDLPPLLMTRENPTGWKLEDLCLKARQEIHIKQSLIKDDPRPQAAVVRANNEAILGHLRAIEEYQRHNTVTLATIGPNNGPAGPARIGVNAPPPEPDDVT